MGVSKTMADALNKQFNEEMNSAYIYRSMAADFYAKNLPGFAVWMTCQVNEELMHAEKIHRYLDEHNERVFYAAILEPQATWKSPLDIIKAALNHEKHITKCIHNLVHLAREVDDIATETFLSWYITEQVEEEASAQSLIEKLEMIGDSGTGLYQLDQEVSTRSRNAPS